MTYEKSDAASETRTQGPTSIFDLGRFAERVRAAVGNGSVRAFARTAGIDEKSLRKYMAGETEPAVGAVIGIAAAGNVNIEWLATGKGPMRPGEMLGPADADLVYVPIPRLTRMEDGVEVEVESEIARVALHRKWLEQKGLEPSNMLELRMPDDSMLPTIPVGGLVVADATDPDKLKEDGLYVILHEEGAGYTVRRLQADFAGGAWVRSDNPAYREQHLAREELGRLRILGRVIWVGGEV